MRVHPDTGRKALYVSEAVTSHFLGMTRDESAGLLEESPGSVDRLPGNAWARGSGCATESATENTPPMARGLPWDQARLKR